MKSKIDILDEYNKKCDKMWDDFVKSTDFLTDWFEQEMKNKLDGG